MRLIADSGSTKTDWRLIKGDTEVHSFSTVGINPYFHTSETVAEELKGMDMPFEKSEIQAVHFYGAGCSTPENIEIIRIGLQGAFAQAEINVYHDLLGAARALFHAESGIAGILGTGSNACLFVDEEVVQVLGGQGFIIGDEGSGMHIGRKLIRDYMNHLMPDDVKEIFESTFGLSRHDISNALYKEKFPNRFLASFSEFVGIHIDHPYIYEMADDALAKYVDRYIVQFPDYKSLPFRVVGSVGYYFKDILTKHAKRVGVNFDKVIRAPIDGLVEYHILHQ